MFVVMVAPECAPVAQAGGLGEVVFGLSRELEIRGNAVEIVLPKYGCLRHDQIHDLCVSLDDLWVPWRDGKVHCTVWFGYVHGRKCYFIEPHSADSFFQRGSFYGDDDVARFAFFCKAAMEFLLQSGKRPDVVHCHDWQTALVPVLLYEQYQQWGLHSQRVCLTVHNFAHQGIWSDDVLWAAGLLPAGRYNTSERLADDCRPGAVNLLRGGIVYSNFVTTVSPQHAWEARFTDQGMGLGRTLAVHQGKFGGILNGVDYDVWNPEVDGLIPANYSADDLNGKYQDKRALRDRLMLRDEYKPIVAYVGRVDAQKGLDQIEHAMFHSLRRDAQFVLLGSATDDAVMARFWHLKHQVNANPDVHLELTYSTELAHLVYAGADLMVMPSLFEPCGLAQMIAMRYGTVPVVRAIGGLCNSVFDRDYSGRPRHQRNGYVFHQPDNWALESALDRAIGLWHGYPTEFRELITNAMRADYSWSRPGQDNLNVYHHIRDR